MESILAIIGLFILFAFILFIRKLQRSFFGYLGDKHRENKYWRNREKELKLAVKSQIQANTSSIPKSEITYKSIQNSNSIDNRLLIAKTRLSNGEITLEEFGKVWDEISDIVDDPLAIAKRKLADGEITIEEFSTIWK